MWSNIHTIIPHPQGTFICKVIFLRKVNKPNHSFSLKFEKNVFTYLAQTRSTQANSIPTAILRTGYQARYWKSNHYKICIVITQEGLDYINIYIFDKKHGWLYVSSVLFATLLSSVQLQHGNSSRWFPCMDDMVIRDDNTVLKLSKNGYLMTMDIKENTALMSLTLTIFLQVKFASFDLLLTFADVLSFDSDLL